MAEERNANMVPSNDGHQQTMYKKCLKYTNYHVEIKTSDGRTYNGILTGADQNQIAMLLPEDVAEGEEDRQFGGYGRRRFRRFRRRLFPLAALVALSLFPYYYPYPYFPYPYPYYPFY